MDFMRRHVTLRAAGRRFRWTSGLVVAERFDRKRQAVQLACKAGEYTAAQQLGDGLARTARRARAFEYHFAAILLKIHDPTHERAARLKNTDSISIRMNSAKTDLERMIQNLLAIVQCSIDLDNCDRRNFGCHPGNRNWHFNLRVCVYSYAHKRIMIPSGISRAWRLIPSSVLAVPVLFG